MTLQSKHLGKKKDREKPTNKNNKLMLGAIALIVVVLAVILLLPKEQPKTSEVLPPVGTETDLGKLFSDLTTAADQVNTFKYELAAELKAVGNKTQTVTISGSGEVDLNNRQMHTNLHITTPDGLQSSEVYMIKDTTYVNIRGQWVKQTTEDAWDFQATTNQRLAELLDSADGNLLGTDMVNGIETNVIRITPNIEKLIGYFMNLQGTALTEDQSSQVINLFKQYVQSVEMKLWVSPQNYIMKAELDADIDMTDYILINARITIHATMSLSEYNDQVIINLPDGAEEAIDLSTIT